MRKIIFIILFFSISCAVFTQENIPTFMFETNVGYAVGVNLDNALCFDVRITYPYEKFGFVLEAGSIFTPNKNSFHVFIGPMMFLLDNEKWRIPLSLGFDFFQGETSYYGIGSIISGNFKFTKNLYAGLNLGIAFAFNNIYTEITGYKTSKEVVDDGTGNAVFVERTTPILENKDHWGIYIYFKPSALIGLQF